MNIVKHTRLRCAESHCSETLDVPYYILVGDLAFRGFLTRRDWTCCATTTPNVDELRCMWHGVRPAAERVTVAIVR